MTDTEYYSNLCFEHVRHSSAETREKEAGQFDAICKSFLSHLENKKHQ